MGSHRDVYCKYIATHVFQTHIQNNEKVTQKFMVCYKTAIIYLFSDTDIIRQTNKDINKVLFTDNIQPCVSKLKLKNVIMIEKTRQLGILGFFVLALDKSTHVNWIKKLFQKTNWNKCEK